MTLQLFKWMMALALMLYLPLLFEQVKGFRRNDRKHSDEYIKERVESIWFDVTHFYNSLGGETDCIPETWPDFDRLYCSEAWNKCVDEFDKQDSLQRGNYWLGQGMQIPSNKQLEFLYVNKVEVIDRTGEQATVSLKLTMVTSLSPCC